MSTMAEHLTGSSSPIYTKTLLAVAIQAFFVSLLITCLDIHVQDTVTNGVRSGLESVGILAPPKRETRKSRHYAAKVDSQLLDKDAGLQVFSPQELAKYKGEKISKGLAIALLGKVYDVSKGEKHYGPGGGYHFFAGRDASRAFVTGDFTDKGLVDDVSGLGHQEYLSLEEWSNFYVKDYKLIGYVKGSYYDTSGRPTNKLKELRNNIDLAKKWRKEQQDENQQFPGCNSEWAQNRGGRVWCSEKSGGVQRDWVGVPRRMYSVGSKSYRCACVRNTGPDSNDKGHRGDLDHPSLKLYKDCDPKAITCKLPDKDDDDEN